MAGSLSATKNQRLAIEALALVSDPDMKLVIAGDGATRGDLEDLAAARGVRSQVDFLGHVSPDRVAAEFARADLFIHTAVGETFGYVYFEAASAGVPVVAVRNPVAEQLVPEFIPGRITASDPQAIAHTIRRSLDEDLSETEVSTADRKRQMRFGRAATAVAWDEVVGAA